MSLLWRYLLIQFLKVFFLCVVAFVAILMTMQLDEIASFATLGSQGLHVVWFTLQQIPYILPIALPIAALIAATLLVRNLSESHELTAFRACGFLLSQILAPVIVMACFLSILNFYIVSELSTTSHFNTGQLKSQLRSINPLLLLNNKHLMRIKGFYFDTLGHSKIGEYAEDILFFSQNRHEDRIYLMVAKKIQALPGEFLTNQMTLLTGKSLQNDHSQAFIVENIEESTISIQDFSQVLENKVWTINNDHLNLKQLLIRFSKIPAESLKGKNEIITEVMRRFSVAIAVLSFTWLGLSFGINISRRPSNFKIFWVVGLSAFFLSTFFIAKQFSYSIFISGLLYFVPHLMIGIAALWMLRKVSHGFE